MLSDLTYTTDFLNNRIVKVDGSPGKHVWIDNQSTKITTAPPLQYQSQNVNIVPDSEGIYTFPTGFQGEFSDRLPFVECARTLTGSFSSDESAFTSNNQRNVYQSLPDIHNSVLESKPDTGNREELSTPVTITPLDTSLLLSTSNYLYGQMNEAPPALGVDRYTVEQNEDTNGLLINGIESSLGAVTNTETRLDFERSSNMHPYSFNNNSINTGQSGAGEDSANVTSSSPYTSLFWFDDPGQTATEQDYEDPSNSVQLFQPPHSEATQSEEHVTLAMDSFPQDALEEVYLACESRSEPLKAQQPFIQDTSTDAEISHNKRTDDITDAKRDRLTGKFKQNVAEHSSTTEKLCKVCNDRAVNHNFGQLTCESCKAFFRRNAHKELTCTLKSGEHEITPTTRRECPACRLKKCFRVGMRPDLIQVRKKDGSKPRWLEKVPSAAIVHEKHLQATDSNIWNSSTSVSSTTRSKTENGSERSIKQPQMSKDYREDVCSTDSGSCLSVEAMSLPLDTNATGFGGKRSKPKALESVELMEIGPSNEVLFHDPPADTSRNSSVEGTLTSIISDAGKQSVGIYPTTDGLLQTTQVVSATAVDSVKSQPVIFQPLVTASMPNIMTSVNNTPSTVGEVVQTLDPSVPCNLNTSCIPPPLPPPSSKVEQLNGLEDFILLANTPRLIVPTNVVTIATASPVDQSPLNSASIQSVNRAFGINMNTLELGQTQALNSQLHYTTYTKFSHEQSIQTLPSNNVIIESPNRGIAQPLLTPIWNSHPGSSLSNGIIQVATQTEPIAQTLMSSMPKCVLATSIQPLQPVTRTATIVNTSEHIANGPFKPVAVTGAASFRLSVQSVPASVNAVTLTAVLPSVNSFPTQLVPPTKTVPHESSMLMDADSASCKLTEDISTPSALAATSAAVPSTSPSILLTPTSTHQASYIEVVSAPINWKTANPTGRIAGPSGYPELASESTEHKNQLDSTTSTMGGFSEMHWETTSTGVLDPQSSTNPPNNAISLSSNSMIPMSVDLGESNPDMLTIPCDLEDVSAAWTAMWRNGEFLNPENINLQIDTDTGSSLPWRLTLANIWDDILLRRISVFAVALFGPLCNSDVVKQRMTESTGNKISSETWSSDSSHRVISCAESTSQPANDEHKYGQVHPVLTWQDLLWLAKHRFADCVPILLIGCLITAEDNDACSRFSDCLPAKHYTSQNAVVDDSVGSCDKIKLKLSPMCSKQTQSAVSSCLKYLNNSQKDVQGSEKSETEPSLLQTGEPVAQTVVKFRCNPGGAVLLSLTKLSHCLAQLTIKAVRPATQEHSEQLAYPILQYLDAYIAQFGNFLAHQPQLMGAFLALKLTDPQFVEENSDVSDLDTSSHLGSLSVDVAGRKERLGKLHSHFVHVFSEAADTVAFSASRKLMSSLSGRTTEFSGALELHPQEVAAANSRRAMLQDFLTWSRQFDAAWHEFQSDTWHQAVAVNQQTNAEDEQLRIAHGLNMLFSHVATSSSSETLSNGVDGQEFKTKEVASHGLLQLLLDAKAELCFGLQSAH